MISMNPDISPWHAYIWLMWKSPKLVFFSQANNDFEITHQFFNYLLRIQRRYRMSNGLYLQLLSFRPIISKRQRNCHCWKERRKNRFFDGFFNLFFIFSCLSSIGCYINDVWGMETYPITCGLVRKWYLRLWPSALWSQPAGWPWGPYFHNTSAGKCWRWSCGYQHLYPLPIPDASRSVLI